MKKEIRDRVKDLENEIMGLKKNNDEIMVQGQILQQKIAQNNTEILKKQGAIEELKRMKE